MNIKKINRLVNESSLNKVQLAERCNVSRTTLDNLLSGADVKISTLESLAKALEVSISYLLDESDIKVEQIENHKVKKSYTSGRPYYNSDFIGGLDLVFNDQNATPEYNIDFEPYNKPDVIWCNITGRSMEPEINSGDIIAIQEVKEWEKFLLLNEIYAIVTKNDLRTVKMLKKGYDSQHYTLMPTNKEFDPQQIDINDIYRVFKVIGCMKRL